MTQRVKRNTTLLMLALLTTLPGCTRDDPAPKRAADAEPAAIPSDRLDIPRAVRSNLGITFATVERRQVEQTLRVPGRFEFQPTARREYRTMLPGRVELLVDQFQRVESGQALYRIDAPAWRTMQQEISAAESKITRLETKITTFGPLRLAHRAHEAGLEESIGIWKERVRQLEEVQSAGGGRIAQLQEARIGMATARSQWSDLREKDAELDASRAETKANLDTARSQRLLLLDTVASLLDVDPAEVVRTVETARGDQPRWRAISRIEVRADASGTVESLGLTNGAWADEKIPVVTVVQPDRLRFHAQGLQSDLGVLRPGLPARIVPPTPTNAGRAVGLQDTMTGALALGLVGDPNDRTVDLYMTPETLSAWARPGVTAHLEIVTDASASAELAIPMAAVQWDGLTPVIFRRAPDNPEQAIRLSADLGPDDGRWVVVYSGLRDDDEIVLDGAFQLMLAMSGTAQKGGHFHADGTFHEEDD